MPYTTGKFYDQISFAYPVIDYFLKKYREKLIYEINDCPPGKLLEIGVGSGSLLPLYASHHITGIDISEEMLKKAKQKCSSANLMLMDAKELIFANNTFDYAVMSHVLAVVQEPDKVLEEVYRVLKPGGKLFIINHFTPNNLLKYADRAFQPFSSLFYLKSHFRLDDLRGLEKFVLITNISLGRAAYFKLLILLKP